MKEQNTVTKIECEDEGRNSLNIKAHREVCPTSTYCVKVDDLLTVNNRESRVVGDGGAPEVNNLVYMKRQKHSYAISTHETTSPDPVRSLSALGFFDIFFFSLLAPLSLKRTFFYVEINCINKTKI